MARFGRYKVGFKKDVSLGKLVAMLLAAVITLYVGGQIIENFGSALQGTTSPFYNGFTLIGWGVGNGVVNGTEGSCHSAVHGLSAQTAALPNCLLTVNTGGVLSVVGIVVLAFVIKKVIYIKK